MGRKQKQSSSSSSSFWHPRRRSASTPATTRVAAPATDTDPPLGCMSMVQYLIFAPGAGCVGRPPPTSSSSEWRRDVEEEDKGNNSRGGFQAPRNSLDLDADNLNDIQIQPVFDALACRSRKMRPTAPSSEAETPRTPSLVARLMGIDGLPPPDYNDNPSPARQQLNNKEEKKKRVIPESMNRREPLRSLSCNVSSQPEDTPRASTSARASWDGARLSLQALKEHVLDRAAQYMSLPTSPTSAVGKKKKSKKNATGGRRVRRDDSEEERERTAKEIVRQAKETVTSRKQRLQQSSPTDNKENVSPVPVRKDKLLAVVQPAKPTEKPPPPPKRAQCTEKPVLAPRVALAPKHPQQRTKPTRPPPLDTPTRAKKPDGCERFATRIKRPAPPPASAPVPTAPPAPAPACSSPSSRHEGARPPAVPLEEDPEYSYLRTVLERGGFMRSSPPSRTRPFKVALASPVDPIVFHLLELEVLQADDEARLGPLRHRWNRKLMFHLTQEILADLLLLSVDAAASVTSVLSGGGAGKRRTTSTTAEQELLPRGAALLSRVWKTVRSFPAADCRVVGDIDALVATDLESASVRRLGRRHPAVAEEAGDVAEEVAEQVLQSLLGEFVCVADESLSRSLFPPATAAAAPVMSRWGGGS